MMRRLVNELGEIKEILQKLKLDRNSGPRRLEKISLMISKVG